MRTGEAVPTSRERRIALVAVDSPWRDPNGTFYSFSYGIEKLHASLRADPSLGDVEVLVLDLRSDDPEAFFARLAEFRPTLVGLSAYIWSLDLFAELTTRLRAHDRGVVIVAGGPAARRSVMDLEVHRALRDQLDAIVPGEGEEAIRKLARYHLEPDWRERVEGLELPRRGLWRRTRETDRPTLDDYPSPYQLGLAPPGRTGYVETFRGCPIHCAFCQWGEQKADRVHSAEYLARHLEGLREARVPNAFFLDAAFNLSPRAFRNLASAEAEVGVLRHMTVHGHLYPTHLEEHHMELFAQFGQVQASVGIQSFDEEVLSRLGRPFDVARFERVLGRMRGRLDVDIELIFGLPGDTPESFWRTFERSIALGDTVKVFRCFVLPDALLERADALSLDFDPRSFRLRSSPGWPADVMEREWARVVARASAFPRPILADDWVGFVVDADASLRGLAGARNSSPETSVPPSLAARIAQTGWRLESVRSTARELALSLVHVQQPVELRVTPLAAQPRHFVARGGLAYSHRGSLERALAESLRRVIEVAHDEVAALLAPGTETS